MEGNTGSNDVKYKVEDEGILYPTGEVDENSEGYQVKDYVNTAVKPGRTERRFDLPMLQACGLAQQQEVICCHKCTYNIYRGSREADMKYPRSNQGGNDNGEDSRPSRGNEDL